MISTSSGNGYSGAKRICRHSGSRHTFKTDMYQVLCTGMMCCMIPLHVNSSWCDVRDTYSILKFLVESPKASLILSKAMSISRRIAAVMMSTHSPHGRVAVLLQV